MGLILRAVDEIRMGLRELDLDDLKSLTWMWSDLNDGRTPAEVALRLLNDIKKC